MQMRSDSPNDDWVIEHRMNETNDGKEFMHSFTPLEQRAMYKFRVELVRIDIEGKEMLCDPGPETDWVRFNCSSKCYLSLLYVI